MPKCSVAPIRTSVVFRRYFNALDVITPYGPPGPNPPSYVRLIPSEPPETGPRCKRSMVERNGVWLCPDCDSPEP